MWGAFVTGLSNKSVELIEEKDNEIKKNMELQLKDLYASRAEARKKSETRRDELRNAAAQLKSFGLDDAGIVKVLSSGNYDNISKLLQNEATSGTLTPQKIKGFIGEAEPNIPPDLEAFFNKSTQLTQAPGTKPLSTEATGAFGFRSRAAEDVTERFLKAQNISRDELQQTQLADMPMLGSSFNYGVLSREKDSFDKQKDAVKRRLLAAEEGSEEYNKARQEYAKIIAIEKQEDEGDPETLNKIMERAQVDLFNAKTPEERNKALATLNRAYGIKDLNKNKDNDLKESDVRATLRIAENSIIQSMAGPGNTIVVTDEATGERRLTIKDTVKPELRRQIEQARVQQLQDYAKTFYRVNGTVPEVVQRVLGAFTLQGRMGAGEQAAMGATPPAAAAGQQRPAAPTGGRSAAARPAAPQQSPLNKALQDAGIPYEPDKYEYDVRPDGTVRRKPKKITRDMIR
jgi:hypothetical protein